MRSRSKPTSVSYTHLDVYKRQGLAPQIGDADNGRLHILTGYGQADVRDHRHLLAVGAVLFDRSDWWAAAGSSWVEGLWFGGLRCAAWKRAPVSAQSGSRAFPEAGLYILRRQADYALLNCNPIGSRGVGTHKHNDLLAVEMHLGGEDILVDSGCFPVSYTHLDVYKRQPLHSRRS